MVEKIMEDTNKIINILDDINVEQESVDILLIEDDLATIRLLKSLKSVMR